MNDDDRYGFERLKRAERGRRYDLGDEAGVMNSIAETDERIDLTRPLVVLTTLFAFLVSLLLG